MHRRLLLIAFLSLMLPGVLLAQPRPNILLMTSDDVRPQLGCYGDPTVKSPHLDRFAETAVRFDRAYVQCPICSPSRNSFLSGLSPNSTGLRGFGVNIRERVPDVVTLPQHFKNHGYHAAAFGKIFHVYAESILGSEDDPQSWSQPLYLPQLPVWGPEQNSLRDRLIAEARAAGREFVHPHDWPRAETWDDPDVPDDALQDGEIAGRAIEFLKSRTAGDEPFFLAVGFLKPHLPFVAPKRYWDLYDPMTLPLPDNPFHPHGSPDWTITHGVVRNYANLPLQKDIDETFLRRYLQSYLACISYMDACAGRVLTALDDLKLRENTIVVFLGDHGYQMGEHDSWGHKQSNFEISTRAPLLISAPGKARGVGTRSFAEFIDIYPTLCDLTGLDTPSACDGKSLLPILKDPAAIVRTQACSEMVRGPNLGRTIRTDAWRYTEWTDATGNVVTRELYDELQDPEENENVAATGDPALLADLSRRLAEELPASNAEPRDKRKGARSAE